MKAEMERRNEVLRQLIAREQNMKLNDDLIGVVDTQQIIFDKQPPEETFTSHMQTADLAD
jgi:hypothetical protein